MKREELVERVKQTIHEVAPQAEIILYGSRARGDAHAESDGDFLSLLDGVVDDARTDTSWPHGNSVSAICVYTMTLRTIPSLW